ncbi:MAG: TauD/TfdA dioxygenase family protein, partial [Burkholderiales bacterium]
MKIIPTGKVLGATIEGLDLSRPIAPDAFKQVVYALGEHSVIRFPDQRLTGQNQKDFAAQFGELEINVANSYQEPGIPEVMILSNIVENGKPIGLSDAGQ